MTGRWWKKKGGGIGIFIREGKQHYQWEGKGNSEWEMVSKEISWVIICGSQDGGGGGGGGGSLLLRRPRSKGDNVE